MDVRESGLNVSIANHYMYLRLEYTGSIVNFRIKCSTKTLYEGPILSGPRNMITPFSSTHKYDGTNLGANPYPGNTPTAAHDTASKLRGFAYDGGSFYPSFEDFLITSIVSDARADDQYWAIHVNNQCAQVGGCQREVKSGDNVLWAYEDIDPPVNLSEVTPDALLVEKGASRAVTVTDGQSGAAVQGATIDGVTTGVDGEAVSTFPNAGSGLMP
ncbi:MAG: hypothetical protein Q9219_005441 [cf. Caloplaca sp. 3 TL-2023]